MSTTLRLMTVRSLRKIGFKKFRAKNALRQPYICYLGDSFGENIFYHPTMSLAEIVLMVAWCQQIECPVIYDVGGNSGYIASQLAQLLRPQHPLIFSFEPIPATFVKLKNTIEQLGLSEYIFPICSALSDTCGLVQLSYSEWDSVQAQIAVNGPNLRAGDKVIWANALTLDLAIKGTARHPHLIKVDVEGHESRVFRGARESLSQPNCPAIQFELNPLTMKEMGINGLHLANCLPNYIFYFVDEVDGYKNDLFKFGQVVPDLTAIQNVCNIFAVPATDIDQKRWQVALGQAKELLASLQLRYES